MSQIKFFNRWEAPKITISDAGLVKYISLQPRIFPKTGSRHAGNRFHKSQTFIIERLAAKINITGHKGKKHTISSGHNSGKKDLSLNIVEKALAKTEQRTKQNPLVIVARAIENAAPREEVIAIEYGGARYPKAIDTSPQRRIDLALRAITQGAYQKSFNKKTPIEDALCDELINAYHSSGRSNAISKKRDLERQAQSSK